MPRNILENGMREGLNFLLSTWKSRCPPFFSHCSDVTPLCNKSSDYVGLENSKVKLLAATVLPFSVKGNRVNIRVLDSSRSESQLTISFSETAYQLHGVGVLFYL